MREECERDIQSMMMTKKVFNFCKSLLFLPRLEILVRIEEEQVCEPGVSSQILLLVFLGLFEDTRVKHPSIYSYSHVIQIGMKIGMFSYLTTYRRSLFFTRTWIYQVFPHLLLCSIIDSVLSFTSWDDERDDSTVCVSCLFMLFPSKDLCDSCCSLLFRDFQERERKRCVLFFVLFS